MEGGREKEEEEKSCPLLIFACAAQTLDGLPVASGSRSTDVEEAAIRSEDSQHESLPYVDCDRRTKKQHDYRRVSSHSTPAVSVQIGVPPAERHQARKLISQDSANDVYPGGGASRH